MAAAFFGFPQHFILPHVYKCRLWEDANGLDFNPRVEPKANSSCDAERPRAAFRSIGQLEKTIGFDRFTTERLLLAVGARKSDLAEEWTLNPL
jgi:hypothetical protein